jgi:S1-C subfamily serine protease
MRSWIGVLAVVVSVLVSASAWAGAPAEFAAAAKAVAPSLVRVELTLRYDKGEAPRAAGAVHSGGRFAFAGRSSMDAEGVVREERPMELAGFLIGPTTVCAADPMIHPRFLESAAVRYGDDVVKARLSGYVKDQPAIFLELERPLKDAKPLGFDPKKKGPYLAVSYGIEDGAWTISVDGMPMNLAVDDENRHRVPSPGHAVVVDRQGTPVGLTMGSELPVDDTWKGWPEFWPTYSADQMKDLLATVQARAAEGILAVTIYLRSPRKDAGRYSRSRDNSGGATELHVTGVLVGGGRILVLANLKPKVTARLDRIVVALPKGDPARRSDAVASPVTAKFSRSLTDYGALVATLDKPLAGAVAFSTETLSDLRGAALPTADIQVHGEDRTVYFEHRRIDGFFVGWRRQLYPYVLGQDVGTFLFDGSGALVAVPVAHREKVSIEDRYASERPLLTPVAYLKAVLDDLDRQSDASNVPVTEEEEARLAWLGVELQPLNRELARANKVSELTRDGESGAMVSYVYPDSPAAKAGLQTGYILLRLRVEGQPQPLEVEIERDEYMEGGFPWDRLDEVPEQYFERIPCPWSPAENAFTRALTDLGFGKKFTAEFFHDGQVVTKDFAVTASPPNYESAPRFKSQPLGMTVRDLTYEVRRYFQKKEDEPGVVVSKIEPGGKASVAGIKPFEIITHVNDKPVMNVKDFETAAVATAEELKLSVKRMTRGRVVKIKMIAPAKEGEKPAAEKPAGPEKPAAEKPPADQKPAGAEKPAAEKPPEAAKPAD